MYWLIICRPFGHCAEFLVERVYEEVLIPVVVSCLTLTLLSMIMNIFIIISTQCSCLYFLSGAYELPKAVKKCLTCMPLKYKFMHETRHSYLYMEIGSSNRHTLSIIWKVLHLNLHFDATRACMVVACFFAAVGSSYAPATV